jgi:tetratricopeptide (TPR) repeat protein
MDNQIDPEKTVKEALKQAERLLAENKLLHSEIILKQLLKCEPKNCSALHLLSIVELNLAENTNNVNKYVEAIEILNMAIQIDPDRADNYNNLGLAYHYLREYKKAQIYIEKAIEKDPNNFLFFNNLALQYRFLGNYDEAIKCLKKSIELKNLPNTWTNLGGIYGNLKDLTQSEACYKTALEMAPNYAGAHVDLAFAYHLQGKWEEGFREYEWRFEYFPTLNFYIQKYDQSKRWDGIKDLKDKTILLYGEQGLGDTIQFVRYVPKLKELGAKRTIIHCPASLNETIKKCSGVDDVVNLDIVTGDKNELPHYDYQCSLISLPHLLKCVHLGGKPYIKPSKILDIKSQYPNTFNIGISWAGSPAHPNDELRSVKLKCFKPIHDIPNVKLFNLQVDMRKRMYKHGIKTIDLTAGCDDLKIVDMTEMINTFEDSSSIIAGLDLVISCDTALIHLAGAMGVPCWVLIPYAPDWRWCSYGETTPWYDSIRLFRQTERNNWEEPILRMKKELCESILPNQ